MQRLRLRPKKEREMARPKNKDKTVEFHKRVKPEFVPILDAFLIMLKENNGMVAFQPYVPEPEKVEPPKERFGISPNGFLKSIGNGALIMEDTTSDLGASKVFCEKINHRVQPNTPAVIITSKLHEEKDYTAWQDNDRMVEVDKALNWSLSGWGAEYSQVQPEEGYEILNNYKSLATKLQAALKGGDYKKYNELMTELYERIKDE